MHKLSQKRLQNPILRGISFACFAVILVAIYWITSQDAAKGVLLMPLDDVYIHFQYARQLALAEPYVYNPGSDPTSGATSLLYPFILAVGYSFGFQGLQLGLWAMLVGAMALVAAMEAIFRLCGAFDGSDWVSIGVAWLFGLSGAFHWHFLSGMETGVVTALLLWIFLFVVQKRLFFFVIVATLLSLMRPEGGIWAGIACVVMIFHTWSEAAKTRRRLLWLVVPIFAVGVQPLVNIWVTGSSVATGNQAKSILATIPQDWSVIIARIFENFSRMWLEFFIGYGQQGWSLPPLLGAIAIVGIGLMLLERQYRWIGLMLAGWLLVGTAAISTLDTAFWHFKRYQMPMMALFVPLVLYVSQALLAAPRRRYSNSIMRAYGALCAIFAVALAGQFLVYHHANVGYVHQQPYQMALWLRDNTPEDSLIAVHDVGLMRYMSERDTLDMVGLTTPGAASYWRNGPGSVAEFLINEQPDYIASYGVGHGYGLRMLADTSLYGEPLAEFVVDNWRPYLNVALAANYQAIYGQPAHLEAIWAPEDFSHEQYWDAINFSGALQLLDVANLASEAQFNYVWQSDKIVGFATEYHALDLAASLHRCEISDCTVEEAIRKVNETETFVVRDVIPHRGVFIRTLLQPSAAGKIEIYVDDRYVDTKWIPAQPGTWHMMWTYIPPEFITTRRIEVDFRPMLDTGYYMPAMHLIQQGSLSNPSSTPGLVSLQDDAARLTDVSFDVVDDILSVSLRLQVSGKTDGNYLMFVHLYDDVAQPPVAQADRYFAGMPLGNLLRGEWSERFELPLDALSSQSYALAIGFYNPNDPTDRLVPLSDSYRVSEDGRVWLGEVIIE